MLMLWLLTLWYPMVLGGKMDVLYSWSLPDFIFPNNSRATYIADKQYLPKNNIILDSDIWDGPPRKVFATTPKMKAMKPTGVPATLSTVSNEKNGNTLLLQPYPDWSWHKGTCDGLISVFRIFVDTCNRLWVLDTGKGDVTCPPSIFIFDLKTDKLIKHHVFTSSAVDGSSVLLTIVVDTRNNDCANSFAYVTDAFSYKLVVYDLAQDKSWRFSSDLFKMEPGNDKFTIAGSTLTLTDGLFGIALGPILPSKDRILYFHSLAGVHENWVSTEVIRNASDIGTSASAFHQFSDPKQSQSAAMAMSDSGVLFYSLVEENAIGCWNSKRPFTKDNLDIVAKDDITLQFQSGMKIHGDTIISTSCRFQNFHLDKVPENEVNYIINQGKVSELVKDTKCA